jgi:hypothetical protein
MNPFMGCFKNHEGVFWPNDLLRIKQTIFSRLNHIGVRFSKLSKLNSFSRVDEALEWVWLG